MVQDNRDIQLKRLLMENTRLTNELRRVKECCSLLEQENARILGEQNMTSGRMAEVESLLLTNNSLVSELKESKVLLEGKVAEQEKEIESLRECLYAVTFPHSIKQKSDYLWLQIKNGVKNE